MKLNVFYFIFTLGTFVTCEPQLSIYSYKFTESYNTCPKFWMSDSSRNSLALALASMRHTSLLSFNACEWHYGINTQTVRRPALRSSNNNARRFCKKEVIVKLEYKDDKKRREKIARPTCQYTTCRDSEIFRIRIKAHSHHHHWDQFNKSPSFFTTPRTLWTPTHPSILRTNISMFMSLPFDLLCNNIRSTYRKMQCRCVRVQLNVLLKYVLNFNMITELIKIYISLDWNSC